MENLDADPSESSYNSMLTFTLINPSLFTSGPRLGKLIRFGRRAVETPHYVAITSRGVVPHISQDILQKHTMVSSIYLGLEDCKRLHLVHTVYADDLLTATFQS